MPDTLKPIEVLLYYADTDKLFYKELEKHLSLLSREGLISAWHHHAILLGADRTRTVNEHLEQSSIILLLISADFLASDYCYSVEMTRALQRHQTKQARVLPILLRSVNWKDAPFGHLQVLPTDGRPITTWSNRDKAFANVAAGIYRAIMDLAYRAVLKTPNGHIVLGITDVTIGRAPDNTYVIHDSQVSAHHAMIRQHGGGGEYAIFDLNSGNRTFVNEEAISPVAGKKLRKGDSIRIGTTTFEYSDNLSPVSQKTKEQWILEGKNHYESHQYDEALAAYKKALELDPDNELVREILGRIQIQLGRYDEALTTYEDLLRASPSASAYLFKGLVLQRVGKSVEALEAYQKAREYGYSG